MASHAFLPLLPFLFVAATAAAQGPTPPPDATTATKLTAVLFKGEQYTTLLRLLNSTRVGEQLSSQLTTTYDGLTFFAPTDSAFAKLRAGTLNALTDQQQVQLLLYHVLPRYYSLATFQTASNPLRTEASGPGGVYAVNVTASTRNSLVTVDTGVVDVPVSNTLLAEFPLAVYSLDDVLLPEQMFGGEQQAAAPAPAAAEGAAARKKKGGAVPKSDAAAAAPGPEGDDEAESANDAVAGRGWSSSVAAALAVLAVVNIVIVA